MEPDDRPIFPAPTTNNVAEGDLTSGAISASGIISVDYGNDGPGTILRNGTVTITGSSTIDGAVTSGGNLVTFVQAGVDIQTASGLQSVDGYVGYYGGTSHTDPASTIVMTFFVDPPTGAYTYTQYEPLDHSDTGSVNEEITIAYGVTAFDADFDQTRTTVDITIADSGPTTTTTTDTMNVTGGETTAIDLLDNDDMGGDGGVVTSVTINGTTHTIAASGATVIAVDFGPAQGTLTLSADGSGTYAADPGTSGFDFSYTVVDGDGDTANGQAALCFCAGTGIATEEGETRVEDLAIGDHIRRADGGLVPVTWIGRQTVSTRFGPAERLMPVRFRAGSLGEGVPHADLTVTADHGMVIDDLVIIASALVNGTTIDFVPLRDFGASFTVYHVETEDHDVILANGAPTETFIDYVGRQAFDNHQDYLDRFGTERLIPEMDRPRISASRLVPAAIKARLGIDDAGMSGDRRLFA